MSLIGSNIKKESFPYLIAILFGIVSWGITHIVDRLSKYPIIEYSVIQKMDTGKYLLTYSITNITNDMSFKNISFLVKELDSLDSFCCCKEEILAPTALAKRIAPIEGKRDYNFMISEFQPNCTLKLTVKKETNKIPQLRYSSDSTIYLTKPSLETWILKNEFMLLYTLIIACSLAILMYVFLSK